jgi:hypothetical protein
MEMRNVNDKSFEIVKLDSAGSDAGYLSAADERDVHYALS